MWHTKRLTLPWYGHMGTMLPRAGWAQTYNKERRGTEIPMAWVLYVGSGVLIDRLPTFF